MKKLKYVVAGALCFAAVLSTAAFSWETYDRVVAVVNDRPITQSELDHRLDIVALKRPIYPANRNAELSRILDQYIEDAILAQVAEEESIIVKEIKIDNQIKDIMQDMHITSLDEFKKQIMAREKLPYEDYREELRKSLILEQVMSIAVGFNPPSRRETMAWYNANKDKVGLQVNAKQILIVPKSASFGDEKKANEQANAIRVRIQKGESFEAIARSESQDPATAQLGGDMGWLILGEQDPYFANQLYQMRTPGQIAVVKSRAGYHVVKYLGTRPVAFEDIEGKISGMLAQRNRMEQFQKWIVQQRAQADIRIYFENYIKGQTR